MGDDSRRQELETERNEQLSGVRERFHKLSNETLNLAVDASARARVTTLMTTVSEAVAAIEVRMNLVNGNREATNALYNAMTDVYTAGYMQLAAIIKELTGPMVIVRIQNKHKMDADQLAGCDMLRKALAEIHGKTGTEYRIEEVRT